MNIIYEQAAALPVRLSSDKLQVLLVETRSGHQWTIPKGIIDPGFTATETALAEAFEEAGIKGVLYPKLFGSFSYPKWQGICRVQVFLMKVQEELGHWPEKYFRKRRWVDQGESREMIKYAGLNKIIDTLDPSTLASIGLWDVK